MVSIASGTDFGNTLTTLAKTLVGTKMQNAVELSQAQTSLDYLKLYVDWDRITQENRLAGHA